SPLTVTVNFTTADDSAKAGEDYISASGTLSFAPGETSKPITVSVVGDPFKEGNDIFVVNLSGASNGIILDPQGVGLILNDDTLPGVSISDMTTVEGNNGFTSTFFTVTLTAPSTDIV